MNKGTLIKLYSLCYSCRNMTHKEKPPAAPPERIQTIRRQIIDYLSGAPVSIGMLSVEVGLSEKQLYGHLESLRKQVKLSIEPARCGKCGFEFKDRRRIRKPGKCPRCKSTYLQEPLYSLSE